MRYIRDIHAIRPYRRNHLYHIYYIIATTMENHMFWLERIRKYFSSPKPLANAQDITQYFAQLSEQGTQYLKAMTQDAVQDHYHHMPSNDEIHFMIEHGLLRRVHRNQHDTMLRPTAAVYRLLRQPAS